MIQYNGDVHFNQYAENRANLTKLADEAVRNRSNIIVFPEGSSYGYGGDDAAWCAPASGNPPSCHDVTAAAEPVPAGPSTVYWENFSRFHHVYVLFNLPEADGGRYFNTSVIVGPDGYVAKYRKRALFVVDTAYATPGDEPLVLNTPYGKFGILVCMDATYPGYLEAYKAAGADATILMMDWDEDPNGSYAARTFMADRAAAARLDIFASDVSSWDGTGLYSSQGGARQRNGLPPNAIGQDGISFHELNY